MGILTRDEIIQRINRGIIRIEPFKVSRVGPASIDCTLGTSFRTFKNLHDTVDLNTDDYSVDKISDLIEVTTKIIIQPGQTILGITVEKITLPENICGWIQGRSRFARVGLMVHISSNFIQPNTNNKQVLEIFNAGPMNIAIHPGTAICQIIFEETIGNAKYIGKYQNQESL
jgi:dCTP deaminase